MPMEVSHIWLGSFPSEGKIDQYFKENYDSEGGKRALSEFAREQGVSTYDHDRVERSFNSSNDLRNLMEDHSYSESYLDQVIGDAAQIGISQANVFILADKNEIPSPRSVKGKDYSLWYIGAYKCEV